MAVGATGGTAAGTTTAEVMTALAPTTARKGGMTTGTTDPKCTNEEIAKRRR